MKIIRHFFTNLKASNTNIALFWFFVCSISITNGQALLTDFGTANAYQITYPANLNGVIPQGMEFTFRALNANTGASTLQVNGITATSIVKNFNIPLGANDIKVGHFVKVIYDGTNWQMLSNSANLSAGTIGGGGTVNGVAFFTNNSAITADGTNFSYKNGTYTDLNLGKIKIRSNATNGDNLAIGANAGNTTMAGTFNVMVGGSSGAVITSGSDNAFLGAGAGNLNTSGSSNSFFGSGAGNANSTGQFNTFIGNDAGSVNTSGTNLVVIGKGANVATNNLNNSIAIGANANVGGSNMMALGGTGTDAVKVGIGTGTPLNTLDVVGGARIRNLSSVGTNMVAVNAAGDLQIASAGSFLTGSGTTGQVPYFASSSALLGTNIFRYDGSNVAINTNPAGSYLFQVLQNTSSFPAIYGENDQLSGVGIWGYSSNASGQAGVRGVAVGTGYGVYGSSSGTGYGVFGANSSTGPGVYGQNTSGGIAGFFDAGGTGVAGYFSGKIGIGVAAPGFNLVSRTTAIAATAETLAQFDISDGGGSYVQIKNATNVDGTFEPMIEGNLIGSNNSFVIRGVSNNDAVGAPLVMIDSKFTSGSLGAKPLFGVSNNGTQYLSIAANGLTRINNLSGSGGAVFANTSGDLFVSTSSGASLFTLNGTNIQNVNNTHDINVASISGAYKIGGNIILKINTNGSIYIGGNTGNASSLGSSNYFFGWSAGNSISTGNNNNFMGGGAGRFNSTGNNNSFIGNEAGAQNISGSNNIAIGANSGFLNNNYTNAIAIGANVSVGGSNMMVLGGTSTNAVNVGIGTNSPNSRLHIVQEGSNATIRLQTNHDPAVNGSDFILARSRNTTAAPALLQSGDRIGSIIFQGYDGTAYESGASIESQTAETWASGTKRGANIIFNTVNLSSTIPTEKMRITANGNVGIGTTVPGSLLSVGTNAGFNVNTSGNIISINGLNARFPLTQGGASTFLQNDGTGNLNWVAGGVTSQWTTNASNIYFNTGNVGLGIIAPLYKLHIVESNATPNYSPAWFNYTTTAATGGNAALNIETFGNATSLTPAVYGMYAKATLKSNFASGATGIYGEASIVGGGISRNLTGIWGEVSSANNTAENYGTYGRAFGSSLANYGVTGITSGTGGANNYGGYFQANSSGTNNYGLFVTVAGTATNKYAAVFNGGSILIGTLTGSTGNMVTAASSLQNTIFATTSNAASDAAGVRGENTSASGDVAGVYGRAVSNSNFAAGVYGKMTAASSTGQTYAIYGSHDGNGSFSAGVRGFHSGATGLVYGVQGVVSSTNPLAAAIAGIAPATGFGGYFDGKGYFSRNVGIGTTAPGNNLQIENNGGFAEADIYTFGGNYSAIVLGKARGTQTLPSATLNNDVLGAIIFRGHNGTTWQTTASQIRVDATENFIAGTNMGSRIVFSTVQNASAISNVRMTIDHAGAVSIGDFIAGSRLGVDGGAAIGTSYRALVAPLNGMIVEGNVGIGTNNPQNKLDVFGNMAIGTYAGLNAAPANSLIVSGRVGIGTAAPQAALEFGGANGSIAFAPSALGGVTRIINAANQPANTFAGDPILISAGSAGTSGVGNVGGNFSISGGNAAGTGNNNGGNVVLTPGNRTGTGLQGVVILKDGHLRSTQTTAPVALVSIPGAGTGATCTLSNATDIAGRVNLTTGTAAWAVGTQCRITFNKPFSVPPIIIITPANAIAAQNLGGRQIFATTSNTFFDISFGAAAVSAVAYQFNYVIIETQ